MQIICKLNRSSHEVATVSEQVTKWIVNVRLNGEKMQREYHTKISQELERYIAKQNEQSFCASEVYSYMIGQGITVNLATIYRNLDRLTEKSRLIKFKTASSDSYWYRAAGETCDCHSHLHMQCKECGKIIHLEEDYSDEIISRLMKKYGFELECDNSFLGGVCDKCRKIKG